LALAFMKVLDDGRWSVAIVEERGGGVGELVDFNILPDEESANEWVRFKIGPAEHVYHGPN
jgi:hypothetical protein